MSKSMISRSMQLVALASLLAVILSACTVPESSTDTTKKDDGTKVTQAETTSNDKDSDDDAVMPKTDTQAANLRVVLNALERQHVNLAAAAVRAGFNGQKDFDAAAKSLDANSVEISKAIGSVYGADAEKRFLEIWRSHIGFFVDYTVAAQKGDKAGMDAAVKKLGGYVDGISDFLSQANPNLPRETVKKLVSEHVMHLKTAVDAHGAGDYMKSYQAQTDADMQIGTIADAIAGAIVKQFPEKFSK